MKLKSYGVGGPASEIAEHTAIIEDQPLDPRSADLRKKVITYIHKIVASQQNQSQPPNASPVFVFSTGTR